MIAPTKRKDAIRSGKTFEKIYSNVLPKTLIFFKMADINIAEIIKNIKSFLSRYFLINTFYYLIINNYFSYLFNYFHRFHYE